MLLELSYHERPLLLGSLEASVAELGGGVDEFEFDGFSGLAGRVHQQRLCQERAEKNTLHYCSCTQEHVGLQAPVMSHLSEGEHAFLRPHHAALHHHEVSVHFTVVRKPSLEGGGGVKGFKKRTCCFQVLPWV